ncbi:MAG: hypothetical protein ABIP90_11285 [Vicinamibacterales bacterium]
MSVRVLSFHANYGCGHRGRCCTSGWPIAVDGSERTRLDQALDAGLLVARPGFLGSDRALEGQRALRAADAEPDGPALLASASGRCVFHDDNASGGCRIHRAFGHSGLPLACRQFPRQSVHDPRGVSVTLSHYCPTANDLLNAATGPASILDGAPAFPADAEYIGLTADAALPPLLHPRLAMDWESWWLFEELSVSLLGDAPDPLSRLGVAVEYSREWAVGDRSLSAHLRDSFVRARHAIVPRCELSASRIANRSADAVAAVPAEWRELAVETLSAPAATEVDEAVVRRFLAAHAFASWTAYQGEGLRAWFRAVETAACLLRRTADPGAADLVLRHLADSSALVARWNRAERAAIV